MSSMFTGCGDLSGSEYVTVTNFGNLKNSAVAFIKHRLITSRLVRVVRRSSNLSHGAPRSRHA